MKKTFLIITAFLFITSTAFPQSKVNVNSLKEYGGKAFKVDDDEPYTGRVFDLNKSTGKKTLQGQYKNGLKTGKWTEWDKSGKKMKEVLYKNGMGQKLTSWWDNGKMRENQNYKDELRNGITTYWYKNGQKKGERPFKDGKEHGVYNRWYENGQNKFVATFKNGDLIDCKYWDEDGNSCECNVYDDGSYDLLNGCK